MSHPRSSGVLAAATIEAGAGPSSPVPQRLAVVLPNGGAFDARARRIAGTMAARGHEVTLVARAEPGLPTEEMLPSGTGDPSDLGSGPVRIRRVVVPLASSAAATRGQSRGLLGPGRRILGAMRGAWAQRRASRSLLADADVAHAMGFLGLPVALGRRPARAPRVVYDARDLYADAGNLARLPWPARRVFRWLERRWALEADGIVTVNASLANRQAGAWQVRPPLVVRNCPPRWQPPAAGEDRLRISLGLAPGTPIALYHGGFSRGRGLEQLAAALREPGLEAVHGVYLGYGSLADELARLAAAPAAGGRLHVLPAVPPEVLLATITTADVAVMAIQPDTLNHRLSTPNKLFEAIAAGVPVVASDFPGIREVVADPDGPLGRLVDPTDPAAIGRAIAAIVGAPPAERAALRARCLAAAHRRWNWETESAALVELYGRLTGQPW